MNGNDNSNANEHSYHGSSRIEKHRSFTRKVLSSVEIAFDDPSEEKNSSRSHIVWKGFKCIVFLTCLAYLIRQSAEFYRHFYTYPTNINIRVEETPKIKLPAATLCYRNRISADAFCERFPDLCEKPKNVDEYCQKHRQFCPEDTSSFVIPKHGYYTNFSREVSLVSQQLLFNRSDDVPFTMRINSQRKRPPVVSFVQEDVDEYIKCFSENLHLFQSAKLKNRIKNIDLDTLTGYPVYRYNLSLHDEESFVPWGRPQVFFAIHSPFNPINPVYEGQAIKSGFTYVVNIKLEEDRLLPHPYPTNCTNYNVKLENINETKPRSQEICKELCRSEFFQQCIGCDMGMSMSFTADSFCHERYVGCLNSSKTVKELVKIRHTCLMGCSPDCEKLKYPYTFVETENVLNMGTGLKDKNAEIVVLMKSAEVKILSHDPLYKDGELFSHIGGLIGCWLGISVWAFTSICEKFMRKLAIMKRNYRRMKEESPAEEKEESPSEEKEESPSEEKDV